MSSFSLINLFVRKLFKQKYKTMCFKLIVATTDIILKLHFYNLHLFSRIFETFKATHASI